MPIVRRVAVAKRGLAPLRLLCCQYKGHIESIRSLEDLTNMTGVGWIEWEYYQSSTRSKIKDYVVYMFNELGNKRRLQKDDWLVYWPLEGKLRIFRPEKFKEKFALLSMEHTWDEKNWEELELQRKAERGLGGVNH